MSTTDTPRFTSGLAPALTGLVAEKRGVGYDYAATAADLQQLDRFCRATGHQTLTLPRDLVAAFIAKRPHETETNRHHRQTLVRLVGEYLPRHGVPAYVLPRGGQGRRRRPMSRPSSPGRNSAPSSRRSTLCRASPRRRTAIRCTRCCSGCYMGRASGCPKPWG